MARRRTQFFATIGEVLKAYLVAWTVGLVLGLLFWLAVVLGRVKITGYWRAVTAACQGRLIIAANHPALLEPLLLPLVFFPWYLVAPQRFLIRSMPDQRLLPPDWRWLFPLSRCIAIDRTNAAYTKRALQALHEAVRHADVVVIHPEGGRTGKGRQFVTRGTRRMRRFVSGLTEFAAKTRTRIMPVWVEGTERLWPLDKPVPDLLAGTVELNFGQPYVPKRRRYKNRRTRRVRLSLQLLRRIITTGAKQRKGVRC